VSGWLRTLRLHQVIDAWQVHGVRQGLAGTLLIAVGALTPAYLPHSSPWWAIIRQLHLDNEWFRIVGTAVTLLGLALLVLGWFSLRPSAPQREAIEGAQAYVNVRHWAVLAIWSLPFLLAPPIFSHDAYSYAAQGWLIHNDINPYEAGPGVLPGGFADQVAWVWRYTPAPYGPLSLQIQHLLVVIGRFDPYASALMMRVPALIGVALIGLLLPRIAVRLHVDPAFVAWFGTLNPIIVIDFIGGAHNDALMMGFVVLGFYVATRWSRGWWLGAVLVGIGASIKQPAFLAAYALPFIQRPWLTWKARDIALTLSRALGSLLVSVGVFAAISELTGLGFGWYNAVGVPGLVVTVSPFTVVGQALQWAMAHLGVPGAGSVVRYSRIVGLVVAGTTIVLLAFTRGRREPYTFTSWSYLAVSFFGPALHSWYMLWGGILLPLTKPTSRQTRVGVWMTLFLLSYAAVILSWRNGMLALGIAALAGYAWLAWTHDRSPWRRSGRDSAPGASETDPDDHQGDSQ
jgi:hypothetical protein